VKDKRLTYGLLAIAVIIWGTVLFRFFSSLGDQEEHYEPKKLTRISKQEIEALEEDTFQVIANYADPFFGKLIPSSIQAYSNPSNVGSIKSKVKAKPKEPKETPPTPPSVIWPSVKFTGVIKNKITDKLVGILYVNGKEYMSGNADYVDQVKINGIFKDSIQLEYQGIKRTLFKGQQIQ
jgi:hypothetical protein